MEGLFCTQGNQKLRVSVKVNIKIGRPVKFTVAYGSTPGADVYIVAKISTNINSELEFCPNEF